MPQSSKSAADKPLSSFSTVLDKPRTLSIDDELYEVRNASHLGKEEEVTLVALYKEHDRISDKLVKSEDRSKVEKLATDQRGIRIEMITAFTTIPQDLAEKLPLFAQNEIVSIIAREMKLVHNLAPLYSALEEIDLAEVTPEVLGAVKILRDYVEAELTGGRAEGN